MSEEEHYCTSDYRNNYDGEPEWAQLSRARHHTALAKAGPAADPDPELTLYRQVTGRPVFSRTHAGWLAEYLATGLDLPMERMLALVTEQQHDDLLDGYAAEPGPRTVHDDDGHSDRYRQQRRTGARWQQLRQNALSWWWLDTISLTIMMIAVILGLIAIFA